MAATELQARQDNLRIGQKSLQNQLVRLTEAYLNGVMPLAEYQHRRTEMVRRQQGLTDQEKQFKNQPHRQEELQGWNDSIETLCQRIQVGLEQASFEPKRKLVNC